MPVRDLEDGSDLDQVLLVRSVEVRTKKDGGEFLRLMLGDRTGAVCAMVWDDVDTVRALCTAGAPVHVRGRYEIHARYGAQVRLRGLSSPAPGSFDLADLMDGPPRAADQMEADLRELLATIQHPHLRRLLDGIFGEGSETWRRYRAAPAAKFFHQAYMHGLLEHSLTVAQAVSAISATFPGIDRDVAVSGALLHDIGKLEAYNADPQAIDLTDAGRLQGEIPLGYYRIRRAIEDLEGFPPETAQALLHIILSHHGTLEHGSPVVPCTREATLVHMIDNLGGRLGSFDRLQKELGRGQSWSSFDRAIGGGAYFGAASADDADVESGEAPARAPPEAAHRRTIGLVTDESRALLGGRLLVEISNRVVGIFREFSGKGPSECKTYLSGDLLVVLLRGGFTTAEQTLFEAGHGSSVRDSRHVLQDTLEERLTDVVESLTGRKVLAFMSTTHQSPDLQAEIFLLEPTASAPGGDDQDALRP